MIWKASTDYGVFAISAKINENAGMEDDLDENITFDNFDDDDEDDIDDI